jgi:hypothetical protein
MRFESIKRWKKAPARSSRRGVDWAAGVTLRLAFPDDAAALRRLAALDSAEQPEGALLVAEVAGELWAAVSLAEPRVAIADPFRPTAELVALLVERARLITAADAARLEPAGRRRLGLQTS